jgi:hypothetical protein
MRLIKKMFYDDVDISNTIISDNDYDSQPIPSPSRSNPWGSGEKTLNFLSEISLQFKFGGGDGMHTSGYEESQSSNCASVLVVVKKRNIEFVTNMIIKTEAIPTLAFIVAYYFKVTG